MSMMKKKKALNILKIAGTAIVAILLANGLHLDNAVSAGAIAVLSIQRTKRETVLTAIGRVLAFICALAIARICFMFFGFSLAGFCVFTAVFVGLCICAGWENSITINMLLIAHFLAANSMGTAIVRNEILLFILGVGAGILANIHLKKDTVSIERLEWEIDEEIKKILLQMADGIVRSEGGKGYDLNLETLRDKLFHARLLAETNRDNELKTSDTFDIAYIAMREAQAELLYEMKKSLEKMQTTPQQAEKIADLLRQIAREYHKNNPVDTLYQNFLDTDAYMKKERLPQNRQEFESRALLYGLLRKIEEFLTIKKDFSKEYFNRNETALKEV